MYFGNGTLTVRGEKADQIRSKLLSVIESNQRKSHLNRNSDKKMENEAGKTNGRSSKKLDQIMESEKASKNNSPRDSQLCDLMHKLEIIVQM